MACGAHHLAIVSRRGSTQQRVRPRHLHCNPVVLAVGEHCARLLVCICDAAHGSSKADRLPPSEAWDGDVYFAGGRGRVNGIVGCAVVDHELRGADVGVAGVLQRELHDGLLVDEIGVAGGLDGLRSVAGEARDGDRRHGIVAIGGDVRQRAVLRAIVGAEELQRQHVVHGDGALERAGELGVGAARGLRGQRAEQGLAVVNLHLLARGPCGVERRAVEAELLGALGALLRGIDGEGERAVDGRVFLLARDEGHRHCGQHKDVVKILLHFLVLHFD